jgi:putative endonuclease
MMRERQYYVYLMASPANKTVYVGVTNNLIRRVYEHKNGVAEGFTKRYRVHKLVYYEVANQPIVAIEREKQIKSWSRERKNRLIETMNPYWEDLYNEILG